MAANKALIDGVDCGDIIIVRAALAAGCDVNVRRSFKVTPLMEAARKNYVDIARLLLNNGAAMDAKCSNKQTPLFYACDNRSTETALLLIERGATANEQEGLGRTSLQIAVKRGMTAVVRALLESGQADPNALGMTGKTAMAYVQRRGEEVKKMLTDFSSMENAAQSKNLKAVEGILKRCFVESASVDDTVPLFLKGAVVGPLEAMRKKLLAPLISSNRPDLFESVLLTTWPPTDKQDRLRLLNETVFEEYGNTSSLHVAVYCGHAKFVNYLLTECDMDPRAKDGLNRRPIDVLDDRRDPTDIVRALLLQATQRWQFEAFTERLVARPRTVLGLEELAQSISSVQDIRAVFSLSLTTLGNDRAEMKRVLTTAFTRVINEKLVLDDRDALFVKMALRECLRRELLSQPEFEYWNMQVVKVNMESASWVTALKQSVLNLDSRVSHMEHHVKLLHSEYKQLRDVVLGGGEDGAAIGEALSLFTAVLGAVGVDGDVTGDAGDVFGSVFDLSSPQNVLLAAFSLSEDELSSFVEDPSSMELVVRDGMQACLDQAGIAASELAGLLRDAILSEQNTAEGDDKAEQEPSQGEDISKVLGDLSQLDVGETDGGLLSDDLGPEEADIANDELIAFPFHYAVKHSKGELAVFLDVVEFIEDGDGDVNALTTVSIPSTTLEGSDETTTLEATAAVYASYLGYVDVVKTLLFRMDLVPTEKRFLTMQRAQQRAAPP